MRYQYTTATSKIQKLSKRIRAIQGGTSASKTVSIVLHLISLAQSDHTPTLTSIVSESLPHLRRGAMKDFLDIMKEHNYYQDSRWVNFTYTFETGSRIEFFSVDQPSKVRGPRRDRLFINEANNVPLETFEQLEVRTKEFVIMDWNPTNEFWFYTDIKTKRTDVEHIILTYLDNEALSLDIKASIEQRKERKSWWQVYGLGQLGEVEGKIYKGWQTDLEAVPFEAKLMRRGLDFGYSQDPTALVDIYGYNGGYILDEVLYQNGLLNPQIAGAVLNQAEQVLVVGDSSEPKSIDEIRTYGVSIVGADKGPGSIRNGIQIVQDMRISVTARSVNLIKEYRNYLWATDKDGKFISPNEPEGGLDHALDAARYALVSLKKIGSGGPTVTYSGVKPYGGNKISGNNFGR